MFRSLLIVLCLGLLLLAAPAPAQACDYGVGAFQQFQFQQQYNLGLGAGGCGYGAGALGLGGYQQSRLLQFSNGFVPSLGLGIGYGRSAAFVGHGTQFRLGIGHQRNFVQPFNQQQIIRQRSFIRGY